MHKEIKGLSLSEVADRKEKGLQNNQQESMTKSTSQIIKDNVFTLFNLLNLIIGIMLALVGAFSNLFFLLIIVINCVIGIIQELRARNLVATLSIVNEEKISVLRDGNITKVSPDELVKDDVVKLVSGNQVPADMRVLEGKIEVNEALLTGESDTLIKPPTTELLSGSFVTSGECYGEVTNVGSDSYANQLTSEAKKHKPIESELVLSIKKVSTFTSWIIVPLGLILFFESYYGTGENLKFSVVASAAALLGMLPKGMVLLISIALATAVMKLGKKQILVQDMYAVESLAHVDVLCLDKTGTITEGKMKVIKTDLADGTTADEFNWYIGAYLYGATDNNLTIQALRAGYESHREGAIKDIKPFSSDRKWGAVLLETHQLLVIGAPDRLMSVDEFPDSLNAAQEEGHRVLMFGLASDYYGQMESVPELQLLGTIVLDDPIRNKTEETLSYLNEEGIEIKVISGDNPVTVSNVARRAGLANYEQYIDLSTVRDEESLRKAVWDYTVFGRVSPKQKQQIVQELKEHNLVVGMTGDGVNDILAMKEANCSIAMAEGDPATRQIANLVLLHSDFTSLPDVLFEGRRVVNNVTKVSSIFFIKTIYSLALSILCALTAIAFPFIPIQITLLDLAIEGYPTFFLSFEADKKKVTTRFLPTALRRALPNAILVILNIIVVYVIGQQQGWTDVTTTSLMYFLLIAVSSMAVIKACLPFNPLRLFLAVTTTVGTFTAAVIFRKILGITLLTKEIIPTFIILCLLSIGLKVILDKLIVNKTYKKV